MLTVPQNRMPRVPILGHGFLHHQRRVPHLRDSSIVAKVGIVRSTTPPAVALIGETSKKVEVNS